MAKPRSRAGRQNAPIANIGNIKSDGDRAVRASAQQRLEGLRSERTSWLEHWAELARYIIPRRYHWLITSNSSRRGSPINQSIIDSTATRALRVMSSGMMSGITSPTRIWFKLKTGDDKLDDNPMVKRWLDVVNKRILAVMAKSNFYTAFATMYPDIGCFGTAPMIIYEDFKKVIACFNPCAGEYFLALNSNFEVNGLFREFTMTIAQVVSEFGIANVSPSVAQAYRNAGPGLDKEVIVCHAIEENVPTGDKQLYPTSVPRLFTWRETYWEKSAGDEFVLRMKGFHEQPFIAPRWDVTSNDPYGRSPCMDILGDTKQLQLQQKRKAQAIDKMVNPPLKAPASLKNQPASSLPGAVTYVTEAQGNDSFKPLYEVKPQIADMKEDIQECQARVKDGLYNDLFLMISQLDTVRTATEIDARREEKLIQLGPVLERFQSEALSPAIERIYAILLRSGGLPKAPDVMKGRTLQINYVSILAEAQRAVATSSIERLLQVVGNINAVDQSAVDNIDIDECIQEYADLLGVPAKIIRSMVDVNKIRANRNKAAQQAQQQQQSLAAVQGAQVLSKTDVGGGQNALQMAMGQQGGQ